MPVCPTCGFSLTYKEWGLGNCTSCSSPLEDVSKTADPIAAAAPAKAENVIPAASRPGWGTVRAGLLLVGIAVVMFCLGLSGTYYERSVWGVGQLFLADKPLQWIASLSSLCLRTSFVIGPAGALLLAGTPSDSRCRLWGLAVGGGTLLWIVMWVSIDHMDRMNDLAEADRTARIEFEGRSAPPDMTPVIPENVELPYDFYLVEYLKSATTSLVGILIPLFTVYLWRLATFCRQKTLALRLILTTMVTTYIGGSIIVCSYQKGPQTFFEIVVPSAKPDEMQVVLTTLACAFFLWVVFAMTLLRIRIAQLLRMEPSEE